MNEIVSVLVVRSGAGAMGARALPEQSTAKNVEQAAGAAADAVVRWRYVYHALLLFTLFVVIFFILK